MENAIENKYLNRKLIKGVLIPCHVGELACARANKEILNILFYWKTAFMHVTNSRMHKKMIYKKNCDAISSTFIVHVSLSLFAKVIFGLSLFDYDFVFVGKITIISAIVTYLRKHHIFNDFINQNNIGI